MARRIQYLAALIAITASACTNTTAPGTTPTARPNFGDAPETGEPRLDRTGHCDLAARIDLVARFGDIVTTCSDTPEIEEATEFDGAGCTVHRIEADGSLVPLGVTRVRSAARVSGGRLVLETWGGEIVLLAPSGEREVLARLATEPMVDSTMHRVVFAGIAVGHPDGMPLGFENPRRLYRLDLETRELEVLADDATALLPVPIPDSDAVVYVSTATGVASIWTASAAEAPQQRTNNGLAFDDPGADPIWISRTTVWIDAYRLAFVAEYDRDEVWVFDIRDDSITRMGEGNLPALDADGVLIAGVGLGNEGSCQRFVGGEL